MVSIYCQDLNATINPDNKKAQKVNITRFNRIIVWDSELMSLIYKQFSFRNSFSSMRKE